MLKKSHVIICSLSNKLFISLQKHIYCPYIRSFSDHSPSFFRRFSVDSPSFVRRLSVHSPSFLRSRTENDRRDKEESTTNSLTIMRNQREKCHIASSVEFYHLQIFNLCAINNETYKRANLMKARHSYSSRIDM